MAGRLAQSTFRSQRLISCPSCLAYYPTPSSYLSTRLLRPHPRRSSSSTQAGPSRPTSHAVLRQTSVPVDEDGIPLTPPYSVKKFLADLPAPQVSDEQFVHLHKLAALNPPEIGSDEFKEKKRALEEMVRLVEGVRPTKTASDPDFSAQSATHDSTSDDSAAFYIPDGRIWPEGEGIRLDEEAILRPSKRRASQPSRKMSPSAISEDNEMLKLAAKHVAGYYVVKRHNTAVEVE